MFRCSKATAIATLCALFACTGDAVAQCCSTQTVGYSPVVYQQTSTAYTGWYPGKWLGNFLFGRPAVTTTYSAGYAPTSYATPYTAGYAPTYTYQTAYRPTYPATYGPVVQTVSRPVVLSPVVSSCSGCATGCDACSTCGVAQAVYDSPSTGCTNCAQGATYYEPSASTYSEPSRAPTLAPQDNPPAERSMLEKPELPETESDSFDSTEEGFDSDNAYWEAPKLFNPNDKTASRVTVPVRNAVYKKPAPAYAASASVAAGKPSHQVGASGWVSASK